MPGIVRSADPMVLKGYCRMQMRSSSRLCCLRNVSKDRPDRFLDK
jgi:hypothetical protein